jgi:hypothetical protein
MVAAEQFRAMIAFARWIEITFVPVCGWAASKGFNTEKQGEGTEVHGEDGFWVLRACVQ